MSIARLMNQPLTVQKVGAPTQDAYGSWIPGDVGAPVATTGFLTQESSTEFLVNRDTTVTLWKAFLPGGTDVGHLDYINFNGQKFQVDGEPYHVWNPRTQSVAFIECKLVVVSG